VTTRPRRAAGPGQAVLELPPLPQHAVRVNEVLALTYTTRETENWWAMWRGHGPEQRFVIVTAGFIGDSVDVLCDDREHAEWLHADLIERGIPKAALKIVERAQQ
jgi:hypothetical protein